MSRLFARNHSLERSGRLFQFYQYTPTRSIFPSLDILSDFLAQCETFVNSYCRQRGYTSFLTEYKEDCTKHSFTLLKSATIIGRHPALESAAETRQVAISVWMRKHKSGWWPIQRHPDVGSELMRGSMRTSLASPVSHHQTSLLNSGQVQSLTIWKVHRNFQKFAKR